MWFALWKSEKRDRTLNYSCDFCQATEAFKQRACYLSGWPGEEKHIFLLPIFDDSTQPPLKISEERTELTDEEVLEKIDSYSSVWPDMPPFEVVQHYFRNPKELCITGLSDYDAARLIELEAACDKYHCLPYDGGIEDQPTILLEAFSAIREASNEYYREKFRDIQQKETFQPGQLPKRLQ